MIFTFTIFEKMNREPFIVQNEDIHNRKKPVSSDRIINLFIQ